MSRRLAALLAVAALLLLTAVPASAGEMLSIPAARERAAVFAANTCAHDSSCHKAGVRNCRRQTDRVVLCRIFDHRKTEEQGNFVCTRLIRLGMKSDGRIPVTGVGDWTC
jgi:hypothetical protein